MMIDYLLAAAAMFVFVFLKAFQQRNVAFDHYLPIIPISWGMAVMEVYVISRIVLLGFDPILVLLIGTGSGLGALSAAVLHKRWLGVKEVTA